MLCPLFAFHPAPARHFERSSPTPFPRFRSCESVGLRREKSLCLLSLWRMPLIILLPRVLQKWYPLIVCLRQPKRKTRDRGKRGRETGTGKRGKRGRGNGDRNAWKNADSRFRRNRRSI